MPYVKRVIAMQARRGLALSAGYADRFAFSALYVGCVGSDIFERSYMRAPLLPLMSSLVSTRHLTQLYLATSRRCPVGKLIVRMPLWVMLPRQTGQHDFAAGLPIVCIRGTCPLDADPSLKRAPKSTRGGINSKPRKAALHPRVAVIVASEDCRRFQCHC
jgi:hypothetical protein